MKNETKLKHTRGSWEPLYVTNAMDGTLSDRYDVDIYGGGYPSSSNDLLVAKLPIKDQNDIRICEDEVRANARLIAAAPELLAALMAMGEVRLDNRDDVDDAILKAIGQEAFDDYVDSV